MTTYALSWIPPIVWGSHGASSGAASLAQNSARAVFDTRLVGAKMSKVVDDLGTVANAHGLLGRGSGVGMAVAFIAALPLEVTPPEVSIDPDGEVAFDWYRDDDMLSVSLGPTGRLTYAWDIQDGPKSATALFPGEMPTTLVEALRRFT
jgi:hypothetical protein